MGYFAEIDGTKTVTRVVVAPSADWCAANLGGTWTRTTDPYVDDGDVVVYCGPGYHFDAGVPEQFVSDEWTTDKGTQQQPDGDGGFFWYYNTEGMLTWYAGKAWRNLMPSGTPNVWEPGVANWREYPMGAVYPVWIQPTGAVDAYPLDFVVEHAGAEWISTNAANVWEPGVVGADIWAIYSPWAPWVLPTIPDDEYSVGDKVTHNNQIWESTADNNTSEPGVADWSLVAG